MRHVAVIGGGASGITAALAARAKGASVTIIEHKNRIGKKILSTGNGKCNYTNEIIDSSCYYGNEWAMHIIEKFTVTQTIDYFKSLGIWPKEKNGYYYPASEQASAVLDVLRIALEQNKIVMKTQTEIIAIKERNGQFQLQLNTGNLKVDAIILACGGCAAPITGSDGSGYQLAKGFGHQIHKPVPGLTGILCKENFFKQLSGIRTQANITWCGKNERISEFGELQLTAYGVSGIPVFQLCRFIARAVEEKKEGKIVIDFMPALSLKELTAYLETHNKEQYIGMFNKKLLPVFVKRYGNNPKQLAKGIKSFEVEVIGISDFSKAQVTCGGVKVEELDNETLESKLVSGLYFAGEIIDVDGKCGGYNLQWAWSSGMVAGNAAGKGRENR